MLQLDMYMQASWLDSSVLCSSLHNARIVLSSRNLPYACHSCWSCAVQRAQLILSLREVAFAKANGAFHAAIAEGGTQNGLVQVWTLQPSMCYLFHACIVHEIIRCESLTCLAEQRPGTTPSCPHNTAIPGAACAAPSFKSPLTEAAHLRSEISQRHLYSS